MNDNTPMRLEQAVEALREQFPVTVSMLRTEIRKRRLTPAIVAGKFFVTPEQIRDLFTPCPVAPKAPASTSEKAAKAAKPPGSSATEPANGAQAALLLALERLRGSSPSTSPTSGGRGPQKSGTVVTLHKSA